MILSLPPRLVWCSAQAALLLGCYHPPALTWADQAIKQCVATGQEMSASDLIGWAGVCGTLTPLMAVKVRIVCVCVWGGMSVSVWEERGCVCVCVCGLNLHFTRQLKVHVHVRMYMYTLISLK